MKYYLELNGKYIKGLSNKNRILALYNEYAKDLDNVLRIWYNGEILKDSSEENK